jgi:glyoxylase-like metal-dependent hydrolase (beta-lactamase superfamily II)
MYFMKIKRIIGGELQSNGYIIYQKDGGSCYIIDPGYAPEKFIKQLKESRLKIKGILLTHHHYDHVGGVAKIKNLLDCPVHMHREDCDLYKGEVDVMLEDQDRLELDGETLTILHTPGHSPGGICIYSERSKVAFTGDTLFNVDLGRTDLRGGSDKEMAQTCRKVFQLWSNEIDIYPGHGDSCNMKFVRRFNKEYLDLVSS